MYYIQTHKPTLYARNFMIDYRQYEVGQLVSDEKFRGWILNPTPENESFWESWLQENPDRQMLVEQAAAILLSVQSNDGLDDEMINEHISRLVFLAEKSKTRWSLPIFLNSILIKRAVMAAATITLLSGLGWYAYQNRIKQKNSITIQDHTISMVTRKNTAFKEMTVLLSDGSIATLLKGASLRFPEKFEGENREVYLKGEAFFDVAKIPTRPFLVFANETVTKVLGTSFLVKAVDGENTVMVIVKTGKVSVYPEKDYLTLSAKHDREEAGVVLSPNQQVVFNKKDNSLDKGIVGNPGMLSLSTNNQELIFDDRPVAEVLQTLGEMYGIEIIFNKETLNGCPISTTFKEENLKQRMNAICQAIGATYEVVDGQIIINSKGCLHQT